ncbi:type II toxin-antitoxin system Phd/YefM family antitoxin [Lactovum odontotermitis]
MKSAPVSDLRNYTSITHEVHEGSPVYLTKNGKEKYALVDIDEWQKMKATLALFTEIQKGVLSLEQEGALTFDEFEAKFED